MSRSHDTRQSLTSDATPTGSAHRVRQSLHARILQFVAYSGMALAVLTSARGLDTIWSRPDLASRHVRSIALLPAIASGEQEHASRAVEARWKAFFDTTGYRSRSGDECRTVLRRDHRRPDSLLDAIARQIHGSGHVSPASAAAAARILDVDALMCLRIDRWERMPEPSPEHTVAVVEVRATLVDAKGLVLWRAAGQGRQKSTPGERVAIENREHSTSTVRYEKDRGGVRQIVEHGSATVTNVQGAMPDRGPSDSRSPDLEAALETLIGRWLPNFPVASDARR